MLQRTTILKYVVPIVALGVLVFSSVSTSAHAAESGTHVAMATKTAKRSSRSTPSASSSSLRNGSSPKAVSPTEMTTSKVKPTPPPAKVDTQRREIPESEAWGQINGSAVNLRSAPNTQGAVVATLKGGDFVHARATQNGWLEVDLPRNIPVLSGSTSTTTRYYVYSKYVLMGVQSPASSNPKSTSRPTTLSPKAGVSNKTSVVIPDPVTLSSKVGTVVAPLVIASTPKVEALPTHNTPVVPVASAAPITSKEEVHAIQEDLIASIDATRRRIEESSIPMRRDTPVVSEVIAVSTPSPSPSPFATPAVVQIPEVADRVSQGTVSLTHEIETIQIATELKLLRDKRALLEETQRNLLEESRQLAEAVKIIPLIANTSPIPVAAEPVSEPTPIEVDTAASIETSMGSFEIPDTKTIVIQFAALPDPQRSSSSLKQPNSAPVQIENQTHNSIVYRDDAVEIIPSVGENVQLDPTPSAVKNVRSKFIVPDKEPRKSGVYSESVNLGDLKTKPRIPEATVPTTQSIQVPVVVQPVSVPVVEMIDLPQPSHEAPTAYRLQTQVGTLIRNVNEACGRMSTDEGILERVDCSPLNGVNFALTQNGRVLFYVMGRDQMDLNAFVGQRVLLEGTPMNTAGSSYAAIEAVSITARE